MQNSALRPVRIAFLIVNLEFGGAQRVVERLVLGLDRRRYHPIVVSLQLQGPIGHEIARRGVRVISLGMRRHWDVGAAMDLYRILRGFAPDILQTFLFHANVLGRVVGAFAGVPRIVSSIHTLEGKPYHLPLERLTWGLSQRVVFVSRTAAAHADRRGGIRGPKTLVIPNGATEPVAGRPGLREELGLRAGPLVVAAGRFVPGKGLRTFLRAAELVAGEFPDARFVCLGGGPLEVELRSMARMMGIEGRVFFPGWRDDVPTALRGCDLFVHPSRLGEGLPNAVIEAMMAGLPVVATEAGGTAEAVVDGETGLLVRTRTPQQLAQAMRTLLSAPRRAVRMGERGRERARGHFGLGRMVERFDGLYRDMCE